MAKKIGRFDIAVGVDTAALRKLPQTLTGIARDASLAWNRTLARIGLKPGTFLRRGVRYYVDRDALGRFQSMTREGIGAPLLRIFKTLAPLALGVFSYIATGAFRLFNQFIFRPLVSFFRVQFKATVEEGRAVVESMVRSAIVGAKAMGLSFTKAFSKVADSVSKIALAMPVIPKEASEALTWMTRIYGTSEGLESLIGKMGVHAYIFGTKLGEVSDMMSEIAKAFNLGVSESERLLDVATLILQKYSLTHKELATAVKWVIPAWNTMWGQSLENAVAMLSVLSNLVARGSGLGFQIRGIERAVTSLAAPSAQFLAYLTSQGLEVYKATEGTERTYSALQKSGSILSDLYKKEQDLTMILGRQGTLTKEQKESLSDIRTKISDQEHMNETIFELFRDQGGQVKNSLELLGELYNYLHKVGASSLAWNRILKDTGGSVRAILTMMVQSYPEIKRSFNEFMKAYNATEKAAKSAARMAPYWIEQFKAVRGAVRLALYSTFIEPLQYAAFKGVSVFLKQIVGALRARAGDISESLRRVGETYIIPTFKNFGELVSEALSLEPNTEKIRRLQESITGSLTRAFHRLGDILLPIIKPVANAFWLFFKEAIPWEDISNAIKTMLHNAIWGVINTIGPQLGTIGPNWGTTLADGLLAGARASNFGRSPLGKLLLGQAPEARKVPVVPAKAPGVPEGPEAEWTTRPLVIGGKEVWTNLTKAAYEQMLAAEEQAAAAMEQEKAAIEQAHAIVMIGDTIQTLDEAAWKLREAAEQAALGMPTPGGIAPGPLVAPELAPEKVGETIRSRWQEFQDRMTAAQEHIIDSVMDLPTRAIEGLLTTLDSAHAALWSEINRRFNEFKKEIEAPQPGRTIFK